MAKQEYHLDLTTDDQSAVELIQQASGLSASEIKRTMQKGAVWLQDSTGIRRLRRAKSKLSSGVKIHVYHDPDILQQTIITPQLIDDQQVYSVWFKPAGALSQGSKWGDHCTINRWIESHDKDQRPAFITHRLDRAACGLMIIAHSKSMARQISRLFEIRDIEKIYRARVSGLFDKETPFTIQQPVNGKTASTTVLDVRHNDSDSSSLLTIRIDSGRKHQIRQHLTELGFPIIGDRLYGIYQQDDLQLCAWSLAFECPIQQTSRFYEVPSQLAPEGLL